LFRVDRDHDALRAEAIGAPRDERRVTHGGAVERDLVGARSQERRDDLGRSDAAADRQWDERLLSGSRDDVIRRPPALDGGRDVEEYELVGSLGVVTRRELDGIAGVAEVAEPTSLADAAGVDVQAWDQPL